MVVRRRRYSGGSTAVRWWVATGSRFSFHLTNSSYGQRRTLRTLFQCSSNCPMPPGEPILITRVHSRRPRTRTRHLDYPRSASAASMFIEIFYFKLKFSQGYLRQFITFLSLFKACIIFPLTSNMKNSFLILDDT